MKKILLFFISATIIFSSCKKDDERIFSQSFDERVNATLNKCQSTLVGAEFGWKAFITVNQGNGGTYSFYMKFNDSNRVSMVSDFDTISAITPQSSSYRLRQQQQPTLIFDTYSYLHVLADPNENVVIFSNVNGGTVGQGLLSDFEFIIDPETLTADTLNFTGKVNGAKLQMVRATEDESDTFLGGGWVLLESYLNAKLLTYFKRTNIAGVDYDISSDPIEKTITFQSVVGGQVIKHTTGYYNTIDGIVLYNPLPSSSGAISEIKIGDWDGVNSILTVTAGSQSTAITETILPLEGAIDVDAPKRWWDFAVDNGETYWICFNGFHVNGVDDAYNINSLTRYYYLIYWPEYDPGFNDLFAPIFINTAGTSLELRYGAAPATPDFPPNGILRFLSLGNYGTYPATGPARLTRNKLFDAMGFYFVQVSQTQYDMVSARDGKAWLRWDF